MGNADTRHRPVEVGRALGVVVRPAATIRRAGRGAPAVAKRCEADPGFEVADRELDDCVAAAVGVQSDRGADPVGDKGVVAPVGNGSAWAPTRRERRTISRSPG
jgi:hypothetical protein